jgi:hypothetical protein
LAFSFCRRWPCNSGQNLSEEWRHLGSLAALSAAVLPTVSRADFPIPGPLYLSLLAGF